MRTNVNRLSLINVDLFYVISIWENEIDLQGKLSSELVRYCTSELGAKLEVNENGWLIGKVVSIELGTLKISLV
jgi:hypothetical protein